MGDSTPRFDRSDLYRHYAAHKRWLGSEQNEDVDRFSGTIGRLNLPQRATILEIGFGEGRFLDWARSKEYSVQGVEILPEMIKRARSRGHIVHSGNISGLVAAGQQFDLIAAFDVIEHLDLPEIVGLFENAERLLTKNGKMVLQFPNAASPFSAVYQGGDATHQTALSESVIRQIAETKGLAVTQFFNARVGSRHPLKQIRNWLAHRMRDVIEMVLSFAYYGARLPLDPNIVVVLERNQLGHDDSFAVGHT